MEKKPSAEHTREIEPTETMKWPEKNEKMPVKKKVWNEQNEKAQPKQTQLFIIIFSELNWWKKNWYFRWR